MPQKPVQLTIDEQALILRIQSIFSVGLQAGATLTPVQLYMIDYLITSASRLVELSPIDQRLVEQLRVKLNDSMRG